MLHVERLGFSDNIQFTLVVVEMVAYLILCLLLVALRLGRPIVRLNSG